MKKYERTSALNNPKITVSLLSSGYLATPSVGDKSVDGPKVSFAGHGVVRESRFNAGLHETRACVQRASLSPAKKQARTQLI